MLTTYFPLRVHTHFSLSQGLSKPLHVARRTSELNLAGAAVTDIDSLSGSIDIIDAMAKRKLKPIIGTELTIVKDYESKTKNCSSLCLIAKNYNGWISIAKAISKANTHYYYEKPHITLQDIADVISPKDVIAIDGWLGSVIGDTIFEDAKTVYLSQNYESAKQTVNKNWLSETTHTINKLKDIFGEDFYLGLQLNNINNVHASKLVSEGIKYLSKKTDTKMVAVPDSYYANQEDAYDQRVLLVNKLGTNLKAVGRKPVQGDDIALGRFFNSTNYHIPNYEEMVSYGHTEEELENTLKIAESCETYSLSNKPMLPQFPCPDNKTSKDYFYELCQNGWAKRASQIESIVKQGRWTQEDYVNRFNTEFEVLTSVGLADYFLIVNDIIEFAINDGQLVGAGRGSAAGSLALYLLGVTHVDPIEYDLLFERFYNAGRNTPGNISLPDIDMDFEKNGRERILHYIRTKYGHERVAQMITFNRMQGRGSFKDVNRAHDLLDDETVNRITKSMPNEPEIADQLEIIKEADKQAGGDGEASIIEWCLENDPNFYKEWAYYDDTGTLQGPLSKVFEQAIRMEGTKRASGKHAAGIVIAKQPLHDICPMTYDSSTGEMIAGMEMTALEKMGHIKFDVLGIATLDKIHAAINHLRTGRLYLYDN